MGSGSSFNEFYTQAAQIQADSNYKIAAETAANDLEIAKEQSEAVKYQAKAEKDYQIIAATLQHDSAIKALDVKAKEVYYTYLNQKDEAEAEMTRSLSQQTAADAKYLKAEADMVEAQDEADDDDGDSGSSSYWYG